MGIVLTLSTPEPQTVNMEELDLQEIPHRWMLGSRGSGPHCPDCLELAGEVRTLGEWQNTIMPGSHDLHCGITCRCSLQSTISAPTRFTILMPVIGSAAGKSRIYLDIERQLRQNFTALPSTRQPTVAMPGRAPSACLPKTIAAERKPWWDQVIRQPAAPAARRTIHGVD
jgi:hypothetical protein